MKKAMVLINAFALMAVLVFSAVAQTPAPAKQESKQASKTTKTKAAATPKSDDDIQKCITDKLAASTKLKADGFNVTVANGVATLTGSTKIAGHKGGAGSIAKSCGAKSIQNNISVEKSGKMKMTGDQKTGAAKKP